MRSQMLKGILEGCILAIIEREAVYGYTLSKQLHENGLTEISEGTIYPVLLRLQKNGYIVGEMRPSEAGPDRKYYTLTPEGKQALEQIRKEWKSLVPSVNNILFKEWDDDGR